MNKSHVLTICQRAYDLIQDKQRWTQNAMARNAVDKSCSPTSKEAVKWCAVGAMDYAGQRLVLTQVLYSAQDIFDAQDYLYTFSKKGGRSPSIIGINDHLSHEKVLDTIQQAIRSLNETGANII